MDREEAKMLLESYRPSRDAGDPLFADALQELARDPELALWFEDARRFDAVMTAKLTDVPVPADLKKRILPGPVALEASAHAGLRPVRPRWKMPAGIAAAVLLSMICLRFFLPSNRPADGVDVLARQAISCTEKMPPLQFVCFNAEAVAGWINQQPGAKALGVTLPPPPEPLSMRMIGASMTEWNGRPVVMVCLQNGRQMAMLYILDGRDAAALPVGASATVQRASWVVRATKTDGKVRVLTTKGGPQDLDFRMPY